MRESVFFKKDIYVERLKVYFYEKTEVTFLNLFLNSGPFVWGPQDTNTTWKFQNIKIYRD